jgi:hypothetical protein
MELTDGRHKKRVAEIQQAARSYQGQNGLIYIHNVVFDDGSKGQHHSTKNTSGDFVVGQEVEYECKVEVKGQYTNYKIKKFKENTFGGGGGGGFKGSNGQDGKYYAATNALKMAVELVKIGKIDQSALKENAEKYYQYITEMASK